MTTFAKRVTPEEQAVRFFKEVKNIDMILLKCSLHHARIEFVYN